MLDLLVLGAGPAGCAAAIHARRAGLSVMILESNERARPVPGETLHPGIEPILMTLGVRETVLAAGFHRHRGVWIEWGGPIRFEPYGEDADGPWHGFQADRRRLNEILLTAAIDIGVRVLRPATPQSVVLEKGCVVGVIANDQEIRARWTADATGSRAWLANQLAKPERIHSPPMRAQFGWRKGRDGQPRLRTHPSGWEWQAPLGAKRTAWVSLRIDSLTDGVTPPLGTDVTWRIHADCAGPGYFLLGDAAARLDPSSSHGVLRALMTGIFCAHAVANARRMRRTASAAIDSYVHFVGHQFEHDVEAMRGFYQRHPSEAVARLFMERGGALRHARIFSSDESRPIVPMGVGE
ncbi:MAG TPA: tryptophan 7-halogenase [Pseudorhodoplanes sp.]|nr:tryptophan 7-halogenase [Pseudorhodoplanes sp.]